MPGDSRQRATIPRVPDIALTAICRCGRQIRFCQCTGAVCVGWVHAEGQKLHGCMATPADGRVAFPAAEVSTDDRT